jgi:hypothetical protein
MFVYQCVCSYFPDSTHTIAGGISLRGTKTGFTNSIFEIEYEQRGMKTGLKSKTGPLRPEKWCPLMFDPNLILIW